MKRIQAIDFFRLISIVAVIVIHTVPFSSDKTPLGSRLDLATFINQSSRFAVPYFFVIAGFFWATKFDGAMSVAAPTIRMVRRILLIFLFWSAFYLLIKVNIDDVIDYGFVGLIKSIYWNLADFIKIPMVFFFEGTKVHLWFLVSLMSCLLIGLMLLSAGMTGGLVILSVILYGVALAGKSYADTPIGFQSDFNFRNGPFFGFIFFASGYFLQRRGPKESWLAFGFLMTGLGLSLSFYELVFIHERWGSSMSQDFVLGTYFLGVGVAMIALSDRSIFHFRLSSRLGPLVLGIYAIHFLFVDMLRPYGGRYAGDIIWEIGYPLSVFILSVASAYLLSCNRFTRLVVV
ncbi:MAG: acyltransferase [Pseudomonadota bacterium]|nr:acyltransferase [Pseudomonadota bacterium]